jgi:type IV secretion system protein VirD4
MKREPRNRNERRQLAVKIVCGVIASLLAGTFVASELFALSTRFSPSLGEHYLYLYPPWAIVDWWLKWHTSAPALFTQPLQLGGALAGIICLAYAIHVVTRAQALREYSDIHGSARWAKLSDIKKAGLLQPEGVYVGEWKNGSKIYTLRHNGPEHVFCYAPPRSGKGVGLVVPTMLTWPHSAVVTDLKREIYELTAKWRGTEGGNRILRFEPASLEASVHINPLDEIRIGTEHETGDIQNLANLIVDPDGRGLQTHWQKTACSLLAGCIAHVLYRARREKTPATLPAVDRLLSDPDKKAIDVWTEMLCYLHERGETHPLVASAARDQLNRPEEEAGSVLSTALSYLTIYRDPVVVENVSRSDFSIRDLMHSEQPVTLYIVTEPVDKQRLQPLVRVLVNMIVRLSATGLSFEAGMPKPTYRHRLLLMLDEFPSLGKLDILQESLAFLPGYGIKAYVICQDINQLHAHYGRDEAITSTCHVQCAFAPNRIETAEHLSKLTGTTTVVKEQVTTTGRGWSTQSSRSTHEVSRSLLTPDEAMRMKGARKNAQGMITEAGNMIVYVAGFPAIMGLQPLYFKDPELARRAAIPAEANADARAVGTPKENKVIVQRGASPRSARTR